MKIREKADNTDFTGYDPVKLLMAEGTDRLWAAGYCILYITVFCNEDRGLYLEGGKYKCRYSNLCQRNW